MLRREIEFLGDAAVAMEELAVDHGARMDDVNRRYNSVLKHHPPFIVEKYSTIGRRQQANPIEADRP